MYRRLWSTLLVAIFLAGLLGSVQAPVMSAQTPQPELPGMDGRVDVQFISGQKLQLSTSIESALCETFEYRIEFQGRISNPSCALPALVATVQPCPLRI